MIQFNLLPSVKIEYIKAARTKRLVITVAILAAGFAFLLFMILFINVNVIQTKHIENVTKDIKDNVSKLEAVEDIDKVLTVQNQLKALPPLHEQKPAANRALSYVRKLTPKAASVSQALIDFDESTISIDGTANSLVTVNKFVDTLKFTKYTVEGGDDQKNAFSEVVLNTFSINDGGATFQIKLKFDPVIFDNTKDAQLIVPSIISTRSQTEKPTDLFKAPPVTKDREN